MLDMLTTLDIEIVIIIDVKTGTSVTEELRKVCYV